VGQAVEGREGVGTLTVFLEDEFAFFVVVFVFASSAIFTSFAFILWLGGLLAWLRGKWRGVGVPY
jgi:hypothetical protein